MLRFGLFVSFILVLLFSNNKALSQDFIQDEVKVIHRVIITAYTASKKECGKSDGITSSGLKVRKGGVACNFLPKGTKIRIPGLFGDRVFIVMDKMASRKTNHVDVYVKHRGRALSIGRTTQSIEIVILG